uniref:Uncharacterized protein n=1 Tax=Anguilla anguilla TaxID=7936 RepID=A0A0E9UQ43_ANGAN
MPPLCGMHAFFCTCALLSSSSLSLCARE